ncbi:PilZ domain-containing protein [uncultured Clostridium sp.]|uniref:flagellar brake protein n=1 Tax=uncultured Clostridium sp. TaxID=59620 RepID=UPI0026123897|nr:PilZ domain-containing protein [uncultured Clostridium sp.]
MDKLRVNDRVEVEIDGVIYKSKIQSLDDNKIYIDIPLHNNEYLVLHEGDDIKIMTYAKELVVYELSSRVLGRGKDGNVKVYELGEAYEVKKIQRRDYVRVNITRVIKCESENSNFDALLLDLSGGGVRLKSSKELKVGDEIIVSIRNNEKIVKAKGKVIRIEDSTNSKFNVIGVQFVDIHNKEREAIIKIVFEIMRKQMELI